MTFTTPPPPQHVLIFQANLSGPPSESFQSFQWFPLPTDLQGIKNDRSLMCLPVIMQHANKAYNVQRAYRGPTIWFLSGGGGRGVVEVIWEKNILKSDFEHKKVLQGNTCHTIALYVREKHSMITRGFGEKNSYANPWNHPNPATVWYCACDTNLW